MTDTQQPHQSTPTSQPRPVAWCSTFCATDPMISTPSGPRPCVPMVIDSHSSSPARRAITEAGSPSSCSSSKPQPLSRRRSAADSRIDPARSAAIFCSRSAVT